MADEITHGNNHAAAISMILCNNNTAVSDSRCRQGIFSYSVQFIVLIISGAVYFYLENKRSRLKLFSLKK